MENVTFLFHFSILSSFHSTQHLKFYQTADCKSSQQTLYPLSDALKKIIELKSFRKPEFSEYSILDVYDHVMSSANKTVQIVLPEKPGGFVFHGTNDNFAVLLNSTLIWGKNYLSVCLER